MARAGAETTKGGERGNGEDRGPADGVSGEGAKLAVVEGKTGEIMEGKLQEEWKKWERVSRPSKPSRRGKRRANKHSEG